MGGTSWDDDVYASRRATQASTGQASMAYHASVASGQVTAAVHESMDPAKMKNGKRESRDSVEHPLTVPIFVGLDVTGSMAQTPAQVQTALPQLMGLLLKQGFVTDPSICVAAIGDAVSDRAPLQVGQFESGIEIDNDIANIYMEGNGGGNDHESYDLALLFLARCVVTDAWEKRQKKGYAFIVADEKLRPVIKRDQVRQVFGDSIAIEGDIPTSQIMAEVLERWELFCIIPAKTSHGTAQSFIQSWKDVLGERVISLEDASTVCEVIASTIGVLEDNLDLDLVANTLQNAGVSASSATSVSRSLAVLGNREVTKLSGTGLASL